MAKAAQARGLTQPDLEEIASDIINSQRREIDQLLDWREQWFGSAIIEAQEREIGIMEKHASTMEHG